MKTVIQMVAAIAIAFAMYKGGVWAMAECRFRQCTAADTPERRAAEEFERSSLAIKNLDSTYFQTKMREVNEDIVLAKMGKRRLTQCEIEYYSTVEWRRP